MCAPCTMIEEFTDSLLSVQNCVKKGFFLADPWSCISTGDLDSLLTMECMSYPRSVFFHSIKDYGTFTDVMY